MNKMEDAVNDLDIYEISGEDIINMKKTELVSLRNMIDHLMAAKKRNEATELLVKNILENNKIYTIRDDKTEEVWIYQEGIYIPNGVSYIKQFCRVVLQDLYTTHISNVVLEKIKADTYIEQEFFFKDNEPHLTVVKNGILNLKSKELEPFDNTKIFFNKIPVEYNPDLDCPKIKQFLKDILEDEKDYLVIQELFGDLLYYEYQYERCFMFIGEGRNGKTKLGDLIKRFLGSSSCCSVHPSTLEDPDSFTISHFFGKRANLSLDINATSLKNISIIKSLSGRDLITAQRKFKSPIDFENKALLIFGANELPRTYDTKTAFWERWILINFPYTFVKEKDYINIEESKKLFIKKRDPSIIRKITTDEEMSGLLNFALEGLERLFNNKSYSYKYTPAEVRNLWIMKSDSFAAFFNTYLEHDYDGIMRKSDLRRYYADFCRKNKLKALSDKAINYHMMEQGVSDDRKQVEGNLEQVWIGVKVKDKFEVKDSYYSQMTKIENQMMLSFTKKITNTEEVKMRDLD